MTKKGRVMTLIKLTVKQGTQKSRGETPMAGKKEILHPAYAGLRMTEFDVELPPLGIADRQDNPDETFGLTRQPERLDQPVPSIRPVRDSATFELPPVHQAYVVIPGVSNGI